MLKFLLPTTVLGLCLVLALIAQMDTRPDTVAAPEDATPAGVAPEDVAPEDVATEDVCAENAAYAKTSIAAQWLEHHPPNTPSYMWGSRAYLDTLYDHLLANGAIDPAPPPCLVRAHDDAVIYTEPSAESVPAGRLPTGEAAHIYGRSEDARWWYVKYASTWGWIDGTYVDLQNGAEIDLIPVRG